jgi:hypothetical protein
VASDAGKKIRHAHTAASAVQIPDNATVPFALGTQVHIMNRGAQTVNISFSAGVTLNFPAGVTAKALRGSYCQCTAEKVGTNEWDIYGDLI